MSGDPRVTAAREYLDGARRRKVAELPPALLVREAAELRRLLGQVLDVIGGQAAALTAGQLGTVLEALRDAMDFHTGKLIACADCDAAERAGEPSAACERHRPNFEQGSRYCELSEALGGGLLARRRDGAR